MAAPKGNQYWKLAHDFKKPKRYQPGKLLDKAIEYAEWCEDNPLYEEKVFGTGVRMEVKKMRAMTIQGFCLFANMAMSTWQEYEKQEGYSAFVARVKALFYSQKVEGAAADLLNSNIIARELGLSDNQKITHNIPQDSELLIKARRRAEEIAGEGKE
jgi:hypothetical protein